MIDDPIFEQLHRARGYFLYTRKGRRFYDCWLADGAAILGHKPKKVLHALKNIAEKGLWGSCHANSKIAGIASVSKLLFPQWHLAQILALPKCCSIRAGDRESLNAMVRSALKLYPHASCKTMSPETTNIYFFFEESNQIDSSKQYLWIYLPFNWENRYVLIFSKNNTARIEHDLSMIELTGIIAVLKQLVFLNGQYTYPKQLGDLAFLPENLWKRNGHYAHFTGSSSQYRRLHSIFGAHQIMLSPYAQTVVLPLHISDSMISLWNKAIFAFNSTPYSDTIGLERGVS